MKLIDLSKLLIVLILLVLMKPAFAQYKSISLGIKAAPNLGWLKTDQEGYKSQGAIAGFGWGLVSEFYFAENYALVSGFNFNFQNGKLLYPEERAGFGAGELTRKYRLKYIELPALIKMKTNEINGFRFFGQIGIAGDVRLASKGMDVFEVPSKPTQSTDYKLIDTQTRLFKASMIVGAGIEYPFDKSTALVAGINFNNGFTNALKGENTVNSSITHHGIPNFIELSIAVMF